MPQVAVAVAAAAAGYGAMSAAVAASIVLANSFGAFMIMTVVGAVTAYAMSSLLGLGEQAGVSASARTMTVRGSVQPRRFIYGKCRTSGVLVYAGSSGNKSQHLHLVIALATHKCNSIGDIYIDDNLIEESEFDETGAVISGDYAGAVIVKRYLGDQTTADADLIAACPDDWTSTHVGYGVTYIYVRLTYNSNLFSGIPNITAVVEGKSDIYDPRTETTGYTDNPALCIRDYLLAEMGLYSLPEEIDDDYFIAAANICDELVDLNEDGTSTQKRFTMGGAFALDQKYVDVVENMLTSCLGALVYVQGAYRLHVAAYDAPTDTLTADELAGEVKLQTRPDLSELFNVAKGTFVDPENYWQESDYAEVTDSAYVDEDGETIEKDIKFPWTTDATRAQRLARTVLRREREALTFSAPVRYAGIRYCVWQTISVTLELFGWENKVFRIYGWKYNPVDGLVELTLREESAYSYAWDYDAANTIGNAPNTSLSNPLTVPAPTDLAVTASTYINADGAAVPTLVATWTASASAFVTAHEVQWRVDGATAWNSAQIAAGTDRYVITPVESGTNYEVRLRAIANLAYSSWTGAVDSIAQPDTTPPGDPSSITVTGGIKQIALNWTNPTDLDLAKIEVWENTSSSTTGRYKVNETTSDYIVLPMDANLTRHYWLRAVDRSGNAGSYVSAGSATSLYATTSDLAANSVTGGDTGYFSGSVSLSSSWSDLVTLTVGSASYSSAIVVNGSVDGTFIVPGDTGESGSGGDAGTVELRVLVDGTARDVIRLVSTGCSGIYFWAGSLPAASVALKFQARLAGDTLGSTVTLTKARCGATWFLR